MVACQGQESNTVWSEEIDDTIHLICRLICKPLVKHVDCFKATSVLISWQILLQKWQVGTIIRSNYEHSQTQTVHTSHRSTAKHRCIGMIIRTWTCLNIPFEDLNSSVPFKNQSFSEKKCTPCVRYFLMNRQIRRISLSTLLQDFFKR